MNNRLINILSDIIYHDLQNLQEKYKKKSKKKDKNIGLRSVKYGADNKKNLTKMDFLPTKVLKKIAKDKDINERKKSKRPGNPEYYKGTRKSNKQMSYEIGICSKPNPPERCYKEWTADKTYKNSKKRKLNEETCLDIYVDMLHERKKKKSGSRNLSEKTRKSLKKKAEKANMPLGALTSVYKKGLGAWLTGHRQGVPQHAWAMARVNSFIGGGKTRSVDKAEWKKVQKHRKK